MDLVVTRTQEECLALIDETVEFYKKNPRGVGLNLEGLISCVYYEPKTKNMCAVGRCLYNPKRFSEKFCSVGKLVEDANREIFKKHYRGYPLDLWVGLQTLHDLKSHWGGVDDRELTSKGKIQYELLMKQQWV